MYIVIKRNKNVIVEGYTDNLDNAKEYCKRHDCFYTELDNIDDILKEEDRPFVFEETDKGSSGSTYKVTLKTTMTLDKFIDTIFEEYNDFGTIDILQDNGDDYIMEYNSEGKIVKNDVPKDLFDKEIKEVTANGGFGIMDYYIKLVT